MTVTPFVLEGAPDGRPCVLSSALGTTRALWEPQLEPFSQRLRLLRYDHPGHGAAPVPAAPFGVDDLGRAVLRMLDEAELERASFCGLSLGGCVGMWLGAHAPERVERLVLACSAPRFGTRESWLERAATVRAGGVEAIADAAVDRWLSPESPRRVEYRDLLASTPAEGYARCCEALADFDARPYLARVEAPTLVVHGADDPSVSAADVALLTGEIRDCRLVELPGARHLANVERPEEFAAAVLGFLA